VLQRPLKYPDFRQRHRVWQRIVVIRTHVRYALQPDRYTLQADDVPAGVEAYGMAAFFGWIGVRGCFVWLAAEDTYLVCVNRFEVDADQIRCILEEGAKSWRHGYLIMRLGVRIEVERNEDDVKEKSWMKYESDWKLLRHCEVLELCGLIVRAVSPAMYEHIHWHRQLRSDSSKTRS
jgi:hypothetical protein